MKTINKYILVALCTIIGIGTQAQLKVDNIGNVGIGLGTATPSAKLDVNGTAKFNGNLGIGTTPSTTCKLAVSGTSYFNGNIGIGAAPTADKLTVVGPSYFAPHPGGGAGFIMSYKIISSGSFQYIHPTFYSNSSNLAILGDTYSPFTVYARNIYYTTLIQVPSDMRLKKNIKKAPDTKNKLNKVNVYQYDLNEKNFKYENDTVRAISMEQYKNQTGVMAQELKEIFPELVSYDSENDVYGVNYVGFIPHLIQAVQDQSKEIETQNKKLESQNKEIESLKTELAYYQTNCCTNVKTPKKTATMDNGSTLQINSSDVVSTARLDQNTPNPFTQETQIGYFIPQETKAAFIFIYDLQGKQLKQIPVNTHGEGSVTIQGREFKAGMYIYSLVIDNELVDTKRMILTE